MKFKETKFDGVYIVELEKLSDSRGFFARSFCKKTFEAQGLHSDMPQCNVVYNEKKGTLRGLHYQIAPHEEVKLVSCTAGAVFDVIVDIRKNAKTYGQWMGVELSAENRKALYIPAGFAHGLQSLCDHTQVFYMMGNYYYPEAARGIAWNSHHLNISWPIADVILSDKDRQLTDELP